MSFLPLVLPFNPGDPHIHLTHPCFHRCHPQNPFSSPALTPVFLQWTPPPTLKFKPVLSEMHLSPQMLILTSGRGPSHDKNQISNVPTIFLTHCPPVLNQWHMLSVCDSPNRIKMSRCYSSHNFSKLFFSSWPSTFFFPSGKKELLSKWQKKIQDSRIWQGFPQKLGRQDKIIDQKNAQTVI